jgi:hypothetical protein
MHGAGRASAPCVTVKQHRKTRAAFRRDGAASLLHGNDSNNLHGHRQEGDLKARA